MHIRWGTILSDTALFVICTVLASVHSYQFDLHAKPVGKFRRSIQSVPPWQDEELYNMMGEWIKKKIEDPLCYTVLECNDVANFEGMVVSSQRKRVQIKKIAHLQDEIGDTIQIPHPYSGAAMKIFTTNLKRSMTIPEKPGEENENSWTDEIEGWVCP